MTITLRKISVEDAPAVSSLSQQLGYEISSSQTAGQINEVMASSNNCAFVALSDEKIIGWIHGFKTVRIETKSFVEIGGLVVDENYRGKGVGKKLIDSIKQWCVEQEVRSLRVRCNTKRKETHQFYLTVGFSEMKEQKIFGIEV